MKKLLLATSAIAVMSGLGASAYVRDGVVEAGATNVELFITGEVSSYVAVTSISAEYATGEAILPYKETDPNAIYDPIYTEDTFIGQDYSADVNFIAKVHSRGWDITGVVEVDFGTSGGAGLDNAYIDFTHASYGTFRTGKGSAPSDLISLEAALPGENWDDLDALQNVFAPAFKGLGNSRFADEANQIGYYSPKFGNMFQFGVAYIFNDSYDTAKTATGDLNIPMGVFKDADLNADTLANVTNDDAIEVAAKMHTELVGFNMGISGAYRSYLADANPGSLEEMWTTGLLLGYMGFNWTTTYGETTYAEVETYDWGIRSAVTYAWDKWEAGIAYEYGQDAAGGDQTIKSDLIEAGLSYRSFPGLTWHGAVAFAGTELDALYAGRDAQGGPLGLSEATADGVQFRAGVDLAW